MMKTTDSWSEEGMKILDYSGKADCQVLVNLMKPVSSSKNYQPVEERVQRRKTTNKKRGTT